MLPVIGNTMTNPVPATLVASVNHSLAYPIVMGAPTNVVHNARQGHAAWNGATLTVSAAGRVNYRYIPAVPHAVSYCILPGQGTAQDCYVISDQYGGCEYHTLYNQAHNMFAFLHVFRGHGMTVTYNLGAGWVLQNVKRSSHIAQAHGMAGSNWSVTHINRATQPATVQSNFIHVNGLLSVTGVSNGNAPYPLPPAPAQPQGCVVS